MRDSDVLAYVKAAAVAVALPLGEEQAQRVAVHFGRTAALARQLNAFPLDVGDEPAELYCPMVHQLAAPGRGQA